MKKFQLFLFIGVLALVSSCKEEGCTDPAASNYNDEADKDCCCEYAEPDNFTLSFKAVDDQGNTLNMNEETVDAGGRPIQFELFLFYLSNIYLKSSTGDEVLVKDVALLDFEEGVPGSITAKIPEGEYTEMRVGFGLDSVYNNENPNDFAPGHPLSYAANTHWGWLKYRFQMVEGRLDTDQNGSLEKTFAYHTGLDSLYVERSFPVNLDFSQGDLSLELDLNWNAFFTYGAQPIDPAVSNSTHMANEYEILLGQRFANNFASSAVLVD